MNTVLVELINNAFFPLTLAGAVWFIDFFGITNFVGEPNSFDDSDKYQSTSALFFLASLFLGIWVSFLIYLAFVGLINVFSYPLPSFGVFLLISAPCILLSFGAFEMEPILLFSPLLGLFEAIVGLFAHSGYSYLANQNTQFFSNIPLGLIAFFGILFGLAIRAILYIKKGV